MRRHLLLVGLVFSLTGCQTTSSFLAKRSQKHSGTGIANLTGSQATPTPLSEEDKAELHLAMASAADKRGDNEAALKAYERARELGEVAPEILHRMALLHDRRGESSQSAELYETILAEAPANHEVQCDFAYSLYLKQDWTEAEAHLREAIRLKPDHSRARNILAMLLAKTGRIDESLAEFARAGVPRAAAHANIGLAMVLQENQAEAQHHMSVAASLDKSSTLTNRLATYRDALKGVETQRETPPIQVASHEISLTDQPSDSTQHQ